MKRQPPKGSPILEAIVLSPRNVVLSIGETQQFTAEAQWSNGRTQDISASVAWTSSDEGVVTVDDSGFVTAQDSGSVVITATLGSVSMGATVTVTGASDDNVWYYVVRTPY